MRIQKYLSKVGIASRREVERDIIAGKVYVNKAKISLGYEVTVGDCIAYKNRNIQVTKGTLQDSPVKMIKYHKPLGEICSKQDDQGRALVYDTLPKGGPWIMIGRLDVNTSGLLLFTNRGDVAHQFMHPSSEIGSIW